MKLPKIDLPLFEIEIPSTKKRVKFRPFTVKEEKILLIAKESKDIEQFIIATSQIIENCVQGIDVKDLAVFDIEYLLLNIRSKSVSNRIEFSIKDPDTEEAVDLEFDIENISVKFDPNHSRFINADEKNVIIMKYPTFEQIKMLSSINGNDVSERNKVLTNIMMSCIDGIQSEDILYKMSDFSKSDIDEFIDNLPAHVIESIEKFFSTMPVLRHEVKYVNSNGTEKTYIVEGMQTFFI